MSEDNSTNEDLTPEQTEKVLHFQVGPLSLF